ncbi:hypothetical protein [Saccharomonospora saliphila]|uniref:hypothetical protein n=1 Tax=Saccharomonospora saliphila TaxID=369829 RepID=UPI0003757C82|nr:hypothetical protein [Saccharomonospora saliphila]
MTSELRIALGVLLVLAVLFVTLNTRIMSAWFRFIWLPRLARKHGWRIKRRMPWQSREAGELPGSGSVDWSYSLPNSECELLGVYHHRPVHAIEYAFVHVEDEYPHSKFLYRWSVVTMATSAQPFGDFHGDTGARTFTGEVEKFYPDFVDWARDRTPNSDDPLRDEGPGVASYSWRGRLSGSKLFDCLDLLAEGR